MIIKGAKYLTSAANKSGFKKFDKPIIAISGKSNVGKSSLINMLASQKGLARTSVTPGRTRLVNYFDFGEFIVADLPGYGFAKVSDSEKEKWAKLMNEFFSGRFCDHTFALVDIRHDPTANDETMLNYLHHYALPFTVIATKADKIGKTRIFERVKSIGNYLSIGAQSVIAVSSETKLNRDKLLYKIEDVINVFNDKELVPFTIDEEIEE